MPSKAEIAILIPTVGARDRYLAELVRRIGEARSATMTYIIGPRDSRIALADHLDDRVIWIEDTGKVPATTKLNRALAVLPESVQFVSFISDDDLIYPEKLSPFLHALKSAPGAVFAYGNCDYVNSQSQTIFTNALGASAKFWFRWLPMRIPQPAVVLRRSVLDAVGGFPEGNEVAWDFELLISMSLRGRIEYVNETVAAWRSHSESTTVSKRFKSAMRASEIRQGFRSVTLQILMTPFEFILILLTATIGKILDLRMTVNSKKLHV